MDLDEYTEKLDVVVCRPALPLDTQDVLAFTARTWDGDDYISGAWQDWLADGQGMTVVAEYRGHAVGLVRLSELSHGQWWIMGLRVDPDHQHHGIASRLHHYILDYWEQHCDGVIRFSTFSSNLAIHHLAERTGFRRILDLAGHVAPSLEVQGKPFQPAKEDDLPLICDFACDALSNMLNLGLIDLGWEWAAIDKALFREAIQRKCLWWWRKKKGLLMMLEEDDDSRRRMAIQYLGCAMPDLPDLLQDTRRLASTRRAAQVRWMAPLVPQAEEPLHEAGFQRDWDESLFVYEKYCTKKG